MKLHLFQGGVKQLHLTGTKIRKWLRQLLAQGLLVGLIYGLLPAPVLADLDSAGGSEADLTSRLTFDSTLLSPVVLADYSVIEVKIGESKAQEAARKERERLAALVIRQTKQSGVTIPSPDFLTKRNLAQRAAVAYGVPWQIVEAVWQVESGKSWDTAVRSSAGAQGPAQFMPATWRRYGVDGNGDGLANIHSAEDAVFAAAHYLAVNGADRGEMRRALLAYNHAGWYFEKVLNVARSIGYAG